MSATASAFAASGTHTSIGYNFFSLNDLPMIFHSPLDPSRDDTSAHRSKDIELKYRNFVSVILPMEDGSSIFLASNSSGN